MQYEIFKLSRNKIIDDIVYDDLMYVCRLIVKVARQLEQTDEYVVSKMGEEGFAHEIDVAQASHCLPIYRVLEETIETYNLQKGDYRDYEFGYEGYHYPDESHIGHMYSRLAAHLYFNHYKDSLIDCCMDIFLNSTFPEKVHEFNTATYITPPQQILYEYLNGYYKK